MIGHYYLAPNDLPDGFLNGTLRWPYFGATAQRHFEKGMGEAEQWEQRHTEESESCGQTT